MGRRAAGIFVAGWAFLTGGGEAAELRVAAAANLQPALVEIAALYRVRTGTEVSISYGSSGNLARQIEQGAPHRLFLSADEETARILVAKGLTRDEGAVYARGLSILFVPTGSPTTLDLGLLKADFEAGRLTRLAIANPDYAPYGRQAVKVLEALGLWPAIRPNLVLGESVAQTAHFALTGSVDAAILPAAFVGALKDKGRVALIADRYAAPLAQRMVVIRPVDPQASAFHDFILSAEAQAIFARHGYAPP
ncbi:MAG: molybdate ABC transporter substrate-binding protein [Rhodospirillales bacterium]|nr:molybdate ABC transporter substrate-binding protein [Rhodospirillales bacterium]